jgi:flavodoxin
MRALVAFDKTAAKAAEKVAEGLRQNGLDAVSSALPTAEDPQSFDITLVGTGSGLLGLPAEAKAFINNNRWTGTTAATFVACGASGKKSASDAQTLLAAKGARVAGTICLRREGPFGLGPVSEVELERARAFGERAANNLRGVRPRKAQEKARIPSYKKVF